MYNQSDSRKHTSRLNSTGIKHATNALPFSRREAAASVESLRKEVSALRAQAAKRGPEVARVQAGIEAREKEVAVRGGFRV